jgi:hypothetical protein
VLYQQDKIALNIYNGWHWEVAVTHIVVHAAYHRGDKLLL